jgi:hypothetical protein
MPDNWYTYSGNLHIHTRYSDGEKWHADVAHDAIAAGLDFIIVTDHNVLVTGVEGYYKNDRGRVLLLTGEEVHNVRRQPQASHFLAYGAGKELSRLAADPQALIGETLNVGGYGFLAHPFERELALIDSPDLGWHDWDIEGFSGLEIWNYMSGFKNTVAEQLDGLRWKNKLFALLTALRMTLHPERYVCGPDARAVALWDDFLSKGMRMTAVGNSDAHGTPMRLGPIRREVYPYEFLFRAVNTHVLLPEPLSGDIEKDRRLLLWAIGRGNSWVGYDMAGKTGDFRFTAQGENKGVPGDEMPLGFGATLQVRAPARCRIRIIRHGAVVAEVERETNLAYIPDTPGAYRVECYIPYEGQERGWIFSNPIYLR